MGPPLSSFEPSDLPRVDSDEFARKIDPTQQENHRLSTWTPQTGVGTHEIHMQFVWITNPRGGLDGGLSGPCPLLRGGFVLGLSGDLGPCWHQDEGAIAVLDGALLPADVVGALASAGQDLAQNVPGFPLEGLHGLLGRFQLGLLGHVLSVERIGHGPSQYTRARFRLGPDRTFS